MEKYNNYEEYRRSKPVLESPVIVAAMFLEPGVFKFHYPIARSVLYAAAKRSANTG